MLFSFVNQGVKITQSYEQYFSSSDVLIGSEIEKLIALALFSILLAIGVKRAKNLLSEAAEKQISDVKMIESEKSSRVKTEFLAAMSHELRTPLNGVLGMSEVLKTTDLTETQAGFVDIIEASGQDLLSIIEDILDYTQLEADQTTRHIAPFALNYITAKLDKKLRPKAEKKALDFRIITEGADNILLMGDEARLKRVLINLLDNAIKFTQNGYVLLHIKTTIVDTQSAALSVYVQDSGIGIAEENFEMIYEKFTQVDNSTTRQYGGAGLGLSISQNLVRAEGGEINLDSQLGRGSRFSFEIQLPYQAKQSDEPGKTLARPASITAPIIQIKARALVLSEGDIGMQLKQQMTKMGLTAKCEADVNAALIDIAKKISTKEAYDLLVIDCEEKRFDAIRLIEIINSKPQLASIKTIALYSQDNQALETKLKSSETSLLAKAYDLEDLEIALGIRQPKLQQNLNQQIGSAA